MGYSTLHYKWLIERLAHSLRESTLKDQNILDNQLAAMASDPEIQRELKEIDEEGKI
jgi:hypothetical protein